MRKRRRGQLFQKNGETVSIVFRNVFTDTDEDLATNVLCVFHPSGEQSFIQVQDSVPTRSSDTSADFRVILDEPIVASKQITKPTGETVDVHLNTTHRVKRADGSIYDIRDILTFDTEMHLLVMERAVR